jgi:hypothetical protein
MVRRRPERSLRHSSALSIMRGVIAVLSWTREQRGRQGVGVVGSRVGMLCANDCDRTPAGDDT